jgi:UDP-N-acetylglucosamine 2-epimerase (non-hydrolysing)
VAATRILIVYGTRPEAIKLAPVVAALRRRPQACAVTLCATAQQRELTDQVQRLLQLQPDIDLNLMAPRQSLNGLASRAFAGLDGVLQDTNPDWLLVQGDTTSALVAALAAFHRGVRVGHVEAGLRTGDLGRPFPEELNRKVVDVVAAALFAPTARAVANLVAEGIASDRIFLTGNTVVDALQAIAGQLPPRAAGRDPEVLVTVHRRESFGAPIRSIFGAVADLARLYPATRWVCPVHPNPEVATPAGEILGGLANVSLVAPLDYGDVVVHLRRCRLVLTDSGGLQEEAPTFGTPVLVLREATERPEGVQAGIARVIGVDRVRVVAEVRRLLDDADACARMVAAENPYGDGRAADRIASILTGEAWTPFTSAGLSSRQPASAVS